VEKKDVSDDQLRTLTMTDCLEEGYPAEDNSGAADSAEDAGRADDTGSGPDDQ
jgi:hypothetical protein